MTYQEACKSASESRDGCVHHVNATIRKPATTGGEREPTIDPDGYRVSDWCGDHTVASYVDGRELN